MSGNDGGQEADPLANLMKPETPQSPTTVDTTPGSSGVVGNFCSSMKTSHLIKAILGALLVLALLFVILMAVYSGQTSTEQQHNEEKRAQNSNRRRDNDGLKATLQAKDKQIQELHTKISGNADTIKKLQTDIATTTEQRDELQRQLKDLDNKIKEQEDTIASLNSQISAKNRQIEEAAHTIQQLQQDIQAKIAELAKVHTERLWYQIGGGVSLAGNLGLGIYSWITHSGLSTARNESTVLKAQLTHLHSEVETLRKNLAERLNKLHERNATEQNQRKEIASLHNQLNVLNDEIEQLHKQILDVMNKTNQLQQNYNALVDQYNELKKKKDELQAKYNKLDADYKALDTTYHELEGKYNDLNTHYQTLNKSYGELLAVYNGLLDKNTTLTDKYNKLLKDYDTLFQANKTLAEMYDKLNIAYKELSKKLNDTEKELGYLQGNYTELDKNMTTLLAHIEHLKGEIEQTKIYIKHLEEECDKIIKMIDEIHNHLFTRTLDKFYLHLLPASHNMALKEVLLYNSTADGFSNQAFTEKVNTNRPLLFMMMSEKHHYFGGFFNQTISHEPGPFHDDSAFTFSRNHSEVCYLQEGHPAYHNSAGYLFTFGDHDILIHNQTDPALLHVRTQVNFYPNESYIIPPQYNKYVFYDDDKDANITSLLVYRLDIIKT
jgi:peptidoglycan hydrolase CwlO-like protein